MKREELLHEAIAAVREETVDGKTLEAGLERVARRLSAEGSAETPMAAEPVGAGSPNEVSSHRIAGCQGFQALIPAFLSGALSEPQRLLFEDHTRECVSCRRALNLSRQGSPRQVSPPRSARRFAMPPMPQWGRAAMAAGLLGVAVLGGWFLGRQMGVFGPEVNARVRSIDGELLAFDGALVRPIAAGETIGRGRTVRTMGGSGAVLELRDGTQVELAERSELTLGRRRSGTLLDLGRGSMIVEATKQDHGPLYARTDDCTVSSLGTIFAVSRGVGGSRVSVLDGEVRVDGGGRFEPAVLRSGEQFASARIRRVTLDREVAWSRNAPEYRERLTALRALGREVDATLAVEAGRHSTRLLDLAPAGTMVWIGLPNLSGQIGDAWALIQQRVTENPALAAWWRERFSGTAAADLSAAVDALKDLGSTLGEEVAIAIRPHPGDGGQAAETHEAPLLFAEVVNPAGFDAAVRGVNDRLRGTSGHDRLVQVVDPRAAAAVQAEDVLWVWRAPAGFAAMSPSIERLREFAATLEAGHSDFASSAFRARLAGVYERGAGFLLGVDAASLVAEAQRLHGEHAATLAAAGAAGVDHVLLESSSSSAVGGGAGSERRATVGFNEDRSGIASWLASPAPTGALEYISPDASFAVAGVVKEPVAMFDDLLAIARAEGKAQQILDELARTESELGFSLRDDLAASLGGDAAFAFDGPVLPRPAWKLIVEVRDPARFETALSRLVEVHNREAAKEGKPQLRLGQEEVDGRIFLRLGRVDAGQSADLAYLSFDEGYLLVAPSRALIVEAISRRSSGASLVNSQAFLDRLPQGEGPNFSALAWYNVGDQVAAIASWFSAAAGEEAAGAPEGDGGPGLDALGQELAGAKEPGLLLAYGAPREIRWVSRGGSGLWGLSFERLLLISGSGPKIDAAGEKHPADAAAADTATAETRRRSAA